MHKALRVWIVVAAMRLYFLPQASAVEVDLVVADSANVARQGEPVTTGVPFSRGALKDVSRLALSVGGKMVPAQFTKTISWPDGSVRWALLDGQVDVPAGGKVALKLTDKGGNPVSDTPVRISDGADSIKVSTGPMEFTVNKKKFNLFESLKIDGKEMLSATGQGLVIVKEGGGTLTAEAPTEVKIEQAGPMRAIVCLRGKIPGYNGWLAYTVRITAYAGKKFVTVRTWLENQGNYGYAGKAPEWINFDGMAINLALGLGGPITAACEGVSASDTFKVEQRCAGADWKSFVYTVTGGDKELKKGERTDGVVKLAGNNGTLNVAIRHFWENYEKAIELNGNTLKLWLWPTDGQWPRNGTRGSRNTGEFGKFRKQGLYALPGGVHKGYAAILDFSGRDPKASAATVSAALLAQATPAYYAGTEAATGWFAPADFKTGNEAYDAQVAKWNTQAVNSWDKDGKSSIWKVRNGGADPRGYWYGWMDFGDNLWGEGYSSLHYDWPWIQFMGFLRTGDRAAFDLGETMVYHRVDVDQIWSDRVSPNFSGLTRFERAAVNTHGDVDDGHGNPICSHFWLVGPVLHYMLTGDPKSYECAIRGGAGIERNKVDPLRNNPRADGQARASTWAILNLCALHDMTGEKKYLDHAMVIFNNHIALQWKAHGPFLDSKGNALQYYYSIHPLCELAERTGDETVLRLLKEGCEADFETAGHGNMYSEWPIFLSNLYGYVGYKTKNDAYMKRAEALFCKYTAPGWPNAYTSSGAWTKETGKYLRNGHILHFAEWKLKGQK
jgi:hypothetical protein